MDADFGLRPSDHVRLVDAVDPDRALIARERLDHLCGAFDELSDVQARVIVMRELEGRSYREIAEQLDITRPAVESALFRARRRLESEYAQLSEGRRCAGMRTTIARLAEGVGTSSDEGRLARHARRCSLCRRRARELGVEPLSTLARVRSNLGDKVRIRIAFQPQEQRFEVSNPAIQRDSVWISDIAEVFAP